MAKLEKYLEDYAANQDKEGDILPVFMEGADGDVILRTKQKAFEYKGEKVLPAPVFFDAKGKRITGDIPNIYGGSRISVSVEVWPYTSQETVREGNKRVTVTTYGLTLKPKAVQIIELAAGGSGATADDFGFGVEDGFDAGEQSFADYQGEPQEPQEPQGSEDDF